MTVPRNDADRGFALLVVLWTVVVLTLLVAELTASGRADVQLAANLRAAAAAEAAANGAIHAACFHLLDPAAPWRADGQEQTLAIGGVRVIVRVENEAGKVNPNLATLELLQALIQQLGTDGPASQSLAAAIVDWRFPSAASRAGGLKADQYRRAGLMVAPSNTDFASLHELQAVLGMTPELFGKLLPYLSLLTDAPPDPNFAAPAVMRAIGQVTGTLPARTELSLPLRTVTIQATAVTNRGSRFTRYAAVRLSGATDEPPMQVLTWSGPDHQ